MKQQIPAVGTPDLFLQRATGGKGPLGEGVGRDRGRHIKALKRARCYCTMNIKICCWPQVMLSCPPNRSYISVVPRVGQLAPLQQLGLVLLGVPTNYIPVYYIDVPAVISSLRTMHGGWIAPARSSF